MPEDTTQRDAILAIAAGVQRAWAEYPADVTEAIAIAARLRSGFSRPASPAVEPTPAYAAPGTAPGTAPRATPGAGA
jgi:hypothetical protein